MLLAVPSKRRKLALEARSPNHHRLMSPPQSPFCSRAEFSPTAAKIFVKLQKKIQCFHNARYHFGKPIFVWRTGRCEGFFSIQECKERACMLLLDSLDERSPTSAPRLPATEGAGPYRGNPTVGAHTERVFHWLQSPSVVRAYDSGFSNRALAFVLGERFRSLENLSGAHDAQIFGFLVNSGNNLFRLSQNEISASSVECITENYLTNMYIPPTQRGLMYLKIFLGVVQLKEEVPKMPCVMTIWMKWFTLVFFCCPACFKHAQWKFLAQPFFTSGLGERLRNYPQVFRFIYSDNLLRLHLAVLPTDTFDSLPRTRHPRALAHS
ncbi:unnamed protein product, partial [Nesidiocoris tenuis]